MERYKVAGVVFDLEPMYGYVVKLCQKYLYSGNETPDLIIKTTQEDIDFERQQAEEFSSAYLESLAVYRKICHYLLKNKQGLIFHSSALSVDGKAYLFTAPSGTGKSTHARLWREYLGDKVVMINDDKPIIRYDDGNFYVCGTPWNGKHGLDTNTWAKIEAICEIHRSETNFVEKLSTSYMVPLLLKQTLRPEKLEEMDNLLFLINKMLENIKSYRINCNMDISAAKIAYAELTKENQ